MVRINQQFPTSSNWSRYGAYAPLVASGYERVTPEGVKEVYTGSLSYLEFIALVKKLWEETHPQIPIFPTTVARDTSTIFEGDTITSNSFGGPNYKGKYPAVIAYSLELRKTHTIDPKPRMRHRVNVDDSNSITVYGQKFQNIVSFTVMSKVGTLYDADPTSISGDIDTSVLCDQIIEEFENFMVEFTPIFKACGVSDLVYSRRVSDSEINREGNDVYKRSVMYMLTTEKTYAVENERIQSILVDARAWLSSFESATPSYNIEFSGEEVVVRDSVSYRIPDPPRNSDALLPGLYGEAKVIIRDMNQGATPYS